MARSFTAASVQYLNNASAIVTAAPLSIACWFQSTDTTNRYALFSEQVDTGSTNDIGFVIYADGIASAVIKVQTADGVAFGNADTTGSYTANTWYHAAGVWASATDRRAFLNGGNKGTNATSVTPASPTQTALGAVFRDSTDTWARPLDGLLAEVGLWSAALTDAEVAVLATGISPLAIRPQSLVAYWPLIGRTSPEIDIVGGFDMTLNAAPTTAAHPAVMYPVTPFYSPAQTSFLEINVSKSADYIQIVTP